MYDNLLPQTVSEQLKSDLDSKQFPGQGLDDCDRPGL